MSHKQPSNCTCISTKSPHPLGPVWTCGSQAAQPRQSSKFHRQQCHYPWRVPSKSQVPKYSSNFKSRDWRANSLSIANSRAIIIVIIIVSEKGSDHSLSLIAKRPTTVHSSSRREPRHTADETEQNRAEYTSTRVHASSFDVNLNFDCRKTQASKITTSTNLVGLKRITSQNRTKHGRKVKSNHHHAAGFAKRPICRFLSADPVMFGYGRCGRITARCKWRNIAVCSRFGLCIGRRRVSGWASGPARNGAIIFVVSGAP